jgi:hypothetical protein
MRQILEHQMAHADGLQQLLTETGELTRIFIASLRTLENHKSGLD